MAQSGTKKRGRSAEDVAESPKRQTTTRRRTKTRSQDDANAGAKGKQSAATSKQDRTGIQDAKLQVQDRAADVLSFLKNETKRLASASAPEKKLLASALSPALARNLSDDSNEKPCEAFDDSLLALQRFKEIIARYEEVNKANTGISAPKWMRWKQDVTDLRALNDRALELSVQFSRDLVTPRAWQGASLPKHAREGQDADVTKLALELVDGALPRRGEDTWGTAAYRLAKGYGDMLKPPS